MVNNENIKMKSNEYKMPELEGELIECATKVVLTRSTFEHLIHTLRNQRFIETKPEGEQKKRQAIIDKTYDWMLELVMYKEDKEEFDAIAAWIKSPSVIVQEVVSIEDCIIRINPWGKPYGKNADKYESD